MILIICGAALSHSGIYLTYKISAMFKSYVEVLQVIPVFIISLFMGFISTNNWVEVLIQILGLGVFLFGLLNFFEILKVKAFSKKADIDSDEISKSVPFNTIGNGSGDGFGS